MGWESSGVVGFDLGLIIGPQHPSRSNEESQR